MTDLTTENARLRAALEEAQAAKIALGHAVQIMADTAKAEVHRVAGHLRKIATMHPDTTEKGARDYARRALVDDAALATPAPDAVQEAARVLLDNPQAAAKFVVEYMERETGLPFGDMIGLSDMQRIRTIAGDRT